MVLRPESRLSVLLLLLSLKSAAGKPHHNHHHHTHQAHEHGNRTQMTHPCSRSVSRSVRLHLKREILDPSKKVNFQIGSPGCALEPELDLYVLQEAKKHSKRFPGSSWTCGFCGKKFKSEHYLDLHLERKHMNETPANPVCLAKYCELFNACHEHVVHKSWGHRHKRKKTKAELKKLHSGHGQDGHEHGPPPCNDTVMIESRSLCEHTLTKCFPLEKQEARELHGEFSQKFCRVLDCRIRAEQEMIADEGMMPLLVHLIMIVAVFGIVAGGMWYCVENFEDIAGFLTKRQLAPVEMVRSMTKKAEHTRELVGMDRTKMV